MAGQGMAGRMRAIPGHEFTTWLVVLVVALCINCARAIDCYKCTSINGKVGDCEDEFDRGLSTFHLISRQCTYGYFKGTHCIKLKGLREDGVRITVRDCSDADWGSHCGDIRYLYGDKQQKIDGCLEACDHDGCNAAFSTTHARSKLLLGSLVLAIGVKLFFDIHRFWRAAWS